MKIKLLLFAHLREIVGASEFFWDFDSPCTGHDILKKLERRHPEIASQRKHLKISINGKYAKLTDIIPHNSEVAIFPPVSGG